MNVVDRMRTTPTSPAADAAPPTTRMVGGELGLALAKASGNRQRVAVYSTATLWDGGTATASQRWPRSGDRVRLGRERSLDGHGPTPSSRMRSATVDGVAWPSTPRGVVLPPGEHEVAWSTRESAVPGSVS